MMIHQRATYIHMGVVSAVVAPPSVCLLAAVSRVWTPDSSSETHQEFSLPQPGHEDGLRLTSRRNRNHGGPVPPGGQ